MEEVEVSAGYGSANQSEDSWFVGELGTHKSQVNTHTGRSGRQLVGGTSILQEADNRVTFGVTE